MTIARRGRYVYRLIVELSLKHTKSLIIGFGVGLAGSILIVQLAPVFVRTFFSPIERIGIVGDYTPTTLPQSIQTLVSSGLTSIGPDGTAVPSLAKSWDIVDDNKSYLFHLQTDKQWHSGKKLDSKDINYNIRDVRFVPLDAYTIKVTLLEPFSPFTTLLSKPIFLSGLSGVGPYKVSQIKLKGESIQYLKIVPVAPSNLVSKEFRFYKTEADAIVAYKKGDVDMVEEVSQKPDVANWVNTTVTPHVLYNRVVALYFNMKDSRLKERNIRLGLVNGVPIVQNDRAYSPISKTSWAYTEAVKHFVYDPAQSMKLLDNSPVSTGTGQLVLSTFSPYLDEAQRIAKSWTEIGVPTVVKVENDVSNGFQILLSAQAIPPDPDQYPLWHSTQKDTNITGYSNVKIDKLLEDGRKEFDRTTRKQIYADFAKRLIDDIPAYFLYYPTTYTIKRK